MKMEKELNGTELTIHFEGSLDTETSPQFEVMLNDSLEGVTRLILDFTNLEYITSAGLRAIFVAEEKMGSKDGLVIRQPNEDVYEVFEITGCTSILTFES